MVNDYTGSTEVGTLFLNPQHRGEGAGKLLSVSYTHLDVYKRQVSAHVGRAHHEGKSAIKAAAQFVCEIEDINGKYDGITINTGKIDGGSANNVVPDLAIVRFNIRAPSQEKMEFAIDKVKSAIKNLCGCLLYTSRCV